MMRIVILGGSGMLGHKLAQTLAEDFDTWVTLRDGKNAYAAGNFVESQRIISGVDVQEIDALKETLVQLRPAAVINCVGVIKQLPPVDEPIRSITINSLLPHRVHRLCASVGARLIHFSTDCVFSGRKGMYTEDDPSDALDLYGRTKFLGETTAPGALTIRSSIIGRELATSSGLVEWFLSQRGRRVEGYVGAIYSGFTTRAMSRIVRDLLVQHPNLQGTIQISSDPITKYDLLVLLQRAWGLDVEIVPSSRVQIDRSLDSSKYRSLTGFVPPSWEDMVRDLAADPTPYDRWREDRKD